MKTVRQKIEVWVEVNPDGWKTLTFSKIATEIGISAGSVDRHLPEVVADRDNIMPSEVMRIRVDNGLVQRPGRKRIDMALIQKLIAEHGIDSPRDLAYLTGYHRESIKRALKRQKEAGAGK